MAALSDSWDSFLIVNSARLPYVLAGTASLNAIKNCGRLFSEGARRVESTTENDLTQTIAEQIVKPLSAAALMPAVCFFHSSIYLDDRVKGAAGGLAAHAPVDGTYVTDAQFAALVVQAMTIAMLGQKLRNRHDTGSEEHFQQCLGYLFPILDRCITARPRNAAVHIFKGNARTQSTDEPEQGLVSLIEGLRLDPINCFGAHFTMGNTYVLLAGGRLDRKGVQNISRAIASYETFLKCAPEEHWSVASACFHLVSLKTVPLIRGIEKLSPAEKLSPDELYYTSSKSRLSAVERRHPGHAAKLIALYTRGMRATRRRKQWQTHTPFNKKLELKRASDIMGELRQVGLLSLPDEVFVKDSCAMLGCVHDPMAKLLTCSACRQVKYCCKEHQRQHWKSGHKKVCKKMRAARKSVKADNPRPQEPNLRDIVTQFWDE